MTDDLAVMAQQLRDAGYMVHKIPPCNRDSGHGRHGLITRTEMCEGQEPIPHGFVNVHRGTFDYWTSCSCGHEFNTEDWEAHQREHRICGCVRVRVSAAGRWSVEEHSRNCPLSERQDGDR